MTDTEFYAICAELLETATDLQRFPHYKRTRWNNRKAGRGRFPGKGIIRCFGQQVHVALNTPRVHQVFPTKEAAIEFLKTV